MKVRIFIESSWNNPRVKDGVAMWLVECVISGNPVTREGFIHLRQGTETAATLQALINALHIIQKPCELQMYIQCNTVLYAIENEWVDDWIRNEWKGSNGKEVKSSELWKMYVEKIKIHEHIQTKERHEYQDYMKAAVEREEKKWVRA